MLMLRIVASCICLGLLGGCVSEEHSPRKELLREYYGGLACPEPGALQPHIDQFPGEDADGVCYYQLKIIQIQGNGWFIAEVAERTLDKVKADNPGFPKEKYTKFKYNFHVQGAPQLKDGSEYAFYGVPDDTDLSCRKCVPLNP